MTGSPPLIDFAVTRVFHPPWQTPPAVLLLTARVEMLEAALTALAAVVAGLSADPSVLDRLLVDASGDVVSDASGDVLWN
jgi:hypothetical protein